jgi:PTS system nitrogen regulatory IIA component
MQIIDFVNTERVSFKIAISSKKRALEVLSEIFASSCKEVRENDVLDKLIERERLGTTGFGHGVAIPHGRVPNINEAAISIMLLEEPIDFDAMDNQPVDILFALIVPEEATEKHLQMLSQIAEMLRDQEFLRQLRSANSKESLINIVQLWNINAA